MLWIAFPFCWSSSVRSIGAASAFSASTSWRGSSAAGRAWQPDCLHAGGTGRTVVHFAAFPFAGRAEYDVKAVEEDAF